MLREKYNVIISRDGKVECKSFKESLKKEADMYFRRMSESLHKPNIEDWNGAALVEKEDSYGVRGNSLGGSPMRGSPRKPLPITNDKLAPYGRSSSGHALNADGEITDYPNGFDDGSLDESYKILKTDGFANAYWDMIINENKGKPIYEEIEIDLDAPTIIEPVRDEPTLKQLEGSSLAVSLTNTLIERINDEWTTIKDYNDLIESARYLDQMNVVTVVQDIIKEEHKHIGQLQILLKTLSPTVGEIMEGEIEATKQISDLVSNDSIIIPNDNVGMTEALQSKVTALKYNLNKAPISKGVPMDEHLDYVSERYKILNYILGDRLTEWWDNGSGLVIKLKEGAEIKAEFKSTPYGMKLLDKTNGKEIEPIDALEYPEEVITENVKYTASNKSIFATDKLETNADDLDWINSFKA